MEIGGSGVKGRPSTRGLRVGEGGRLAELLFTFGWYRRDIIYGTCMSNESCVLLNLRDSCLN